MNFPSVSLALVLLGGFTSGFPMKNEENTAHESQSTEANESEVHQIQSRETRHQDHQDRHDKDDGHGYNRGHVRDHDDGRNAGRSTRKIWRRSSKDEIFTETVDSEDLSAESDSSMESKEENSLKDAQLEKG